jgi:hypothetical protein
MAGRSPNSRAIAANSLMLEFYNEDRDYLSPDRRPTDRRDEPHSV